MLLAQAWEPGLGYLIFVVVMVLFCGWCVWETLGEGPRLRRAKQRRAECDRGLGWSAKHTQQFEEFERRRLEDDHGND